MYRSNISFKTFLLLCAIFFCESLYAKKSTVDFLVVQSCNSVDFNDWEAGWGIWNDGGADAAIAENSAYSNSGVYSALIKDNTSTSVFTTNAFDFSEAESLVIDFNFITTGFNSGSQKFTLEISVDGGLTFNTEASWAYITDFDNGSRYFENVEIVGSFSDETQVRFRCDASGNNDKVYIDDISLTTCIGLEPTCDDGVQNGDETGVDCGGVDCEPCAECDEIDFNDGEIDWGIWNDGGTDAARTNNESVANSGTHSFLIKDNTSTSIITSNLLDLTTYDSLSIEFNFLSEGFNKNTQDFWLQLSTDNGATFTTVLDWTYTEDFENGERQFIVASIYGPFSNTTMLRFRCDADGNNDKIYIDDIRISDCFPCEACPTCDDGIMNDDEEFIDCGGAECAPCLTCEGPFSFITQQDVDVFVNTYPDCEHVIGNMVLDAFSTADPITDISGFSNIKSITGWLDIKSFEIPHFHGFENLVSVSEFVYFRLNDDVEVLSGFHNLETPTVLIFDNDGLKAVSAFDNLVADGVHISSNDDLNMITGFNDLVSKELTLSYNSDLVLISGFESSKISEYLNISNVGNLTSLGELGSADFSGLQELRISTTDLSTCSVPSICEQYLLGLSAAVLLNNNAGCNDNADLYNNCAPEHYNLENYTDFVEGWGIWNDGGEDAHLMLAGSGDNDNTYKSVRLRQGSESSFMTSDAFDFIDIDSVKINFHFRTNNLEDNEDELWLQVSTDDGNTFETVQEWDYGIDFENDTHIFQSVQIDGPFTADTKFRFRADSDAFNDKIYIDDVFIISMTEMIPSCSDGMQNDDETGIDCGGVDCDPCIITTCTEIDFEDVELGWGIWNDGGDDALRSDDETFAYSGMYSFLIKDDTPSSVITTDEMDLSSYDSLQFSFTFLTDDFNNSDEDFFLELSTDGGVNYIVVDSWAEEIDFYNGVRYFEDILINGPFTSQTTFRFRCDASGNNDKLYIDDILIYTCINSDGLLIDDAVVRTQNNSPKIIVYPNPIRQNNTLSVELYLEHNFTTLEMYDLSGRRLINQIIATDQQVLNLEMGQLNPGTYILKLTGSTDVFVKKVIVVE